jgi:hypothetical protein
MAYLGEGPNPVNRGLTIKDTFTGDGSTTTFDLATAIPNVTENDIQVFIDNVRQEPGSGDAYTLGFDGSSNFKRITFTAAPESGAEIYVLSGSGRTQLLSITDGSVTASKIGGDAVNGSKIADDSIDSEHYVDGSIDTAHIGDNQVTVGKLASTLDLSSNTVTLPNTSVTNDMLAGSIANAKLSNSSITLNGVTINLGDTTSIAAGTDWQAVVVADGSTVTSATAGEGYFINTTSAAHTITLPASPSIGDEVSVIDYAGTFDTNNLTVGRNSENIQGSAADLTVSTERAGFTLVYVDGTQGWLLKDK